MIGPTAARNNAPVLLTPTAKARPSVAAYIKDAKFEKLTVVGGTGRIPDAVVKELTGK